MNKKLLILTLAISSILAFAPLANAQFAHVTAWTDQPNYDPGQGGTLHIAFQNTGDPNVTLYNATLTFAGWQAYIDGDWVGNMTQTVNVTVNGHSIYVFDVSFTVPSDGRAETGTTPVNIQLQTSAGSEFGSASINVEVTPIFMGQIVTLFTILVVLVIVCTIIIAATIFLSARRPQVTWRAEENPQ